MSPVTTSKINYNNRLGYEKVRLKTFEADFSYGSIGHIGPIWLPIEPIQLGIDTQNELKLLEINNVPQEIETPSIIYLREFFGLGPTPIFNIMIDNSNLNFYGICKEINVIPHYLYKDYIYDQQPLFNVTDIIDYGQTAWGLTSNDFDNDGDIDFAVSWATCPFEYSTITIFYNDENNTFIRDDVFVFEYSYINDLDSNDYDNDGDIDLFFTHSEYIWYNGWPIKINGTGKILHNDGNNNFIEVSTAFWHGPGTPGDINNRINPQVTSNDFDMDGDIDFLVGDNSGLVEFYINNGTGDYESAGIIHDFGVLSWGLTSSDYDNDGDIDLFVSARISEELVVGYVYFISNNIIESNNSFCFNNGPGDILLVISSIYPLACLQVFDYDNDGLKDIITGILDDVFLCKNLGDSLDIFYLGSLSLNEEGYLDSLAEGAFTSSDYNNDGKIDLIIGGVQGVIRICFNNYGQLPPSKPTIRPRMTSFIPGEQKDFKFTSWDFNNDEISYFIDWGDGTNTGWLGPYPSGEELDLGHTWTAEHAHYLKVKSKDIHGEESVWQEDIIVVKNKRLNSGFIFNHDFSLDSHEVLNTIFYNRINNFFDINKNCIENNIKNFGEEKFD